MNTKEKIDSLVPETLTFHMKNTNYENVLFLLENKLLLSDIQKVSFAEYLNKLINFKSKELVEIFDDLYKEERRRILKSKFKESNSIKKQKV